MNIKIRLTNEIRNASVANLVLNNKASNLLNRLGCLTIEDVVHVWDRLDSIKGVGAGTKNQIQNAIINYMITNLDKGNLQQFFLDLIADNSVEDLKPLAEQIKNFEKGGGEKAA